MSLACFYVCGERVSRFSGKVGVSSLVLQMDSFSDLVVVVLFCLATSMHEHLPQSERAKNGGVDMRERGGGSGLGGGGIGILLQVWVIFPARRK